jgi:hypothetical protein
MRGTPDGRGEWTAEWTADEGRSYAGDWREGLPHGYGKETIADEITYWGEFSEGLWHGKGIGIDCVQELTFLGPWANDSLSPGAWMTDDGQITFVGTREGRDGMYDLLLW